MNYLVLFGFTFLWSHACSTCVTPLGRISQCVSIYECPALLAAFQTNSVTRNVVNFLQQSQCGFEENVPTVCCGPIPVQRESILAVEPVTTEDSYPTARDKCGIDTNGDRIYGGVKTELDEFPWMVLLGYQPADTLELTYQCGGALINHRYILSAAHCVVGEIETAVGKLKTARLGEYDVRTDPDSLNSVFADPVQEIVVHSAYPHPGYSDSNRNRRDDISVIRLAQRVRYSYYVQPICLTSNNLRMDDGSEVFIAGWGQISSNETSPVKLKLRIPTFSKSDCVSQYTRIQVSLTDKQMCAGGELAKDSCRGDSGGPLMRNIGGNWEAVGIVSFGRGCGRIGWPGVYTSVSSYLNWIETTMQSSNVVKVERNHYHTQHYHSYHHHYFFN